MAKTAQELAKERLARIEAAINLEEPDRVPLRGIGGDIVAAYAGISQREYWSDYEKTREALVKFNRDFPSDWGTGYLGVGVIPLPYAFADNPDASIIVARRSGIVHEILGDKCTRYPGVEIEDDCTPQYVGGTYMEEDEYDQLIDDPTGFMLEVVLPRICENLETPKKAMATWVRMGMESEKITAFTRKLNKELEDLGYPLIPVAMSMAPLDLIGDGLRDIRNVLLDIRRHPEKVKKACEALVEPILKVGLSLKSSGIKYAYIPLHLNEYLSPQLYKEFYWPYLKKVINGFAEEGIKSIVFFEGRHDAHLETILELPAGWGVAQFDKTDVREAKKILKGHTCVMGGVPISLIISSTPEKIHMYIQELLEEMKPGGGYILTTNVAHAPKETPIENIHALIEAVEKYGKY
jgi:uroporphyrinogen-III decarboxylase